MATTIKLKNGSGAPLAGDLVQGEPAFDLTNKRLYTEDSGGTVIEVGTNPTSLTTGTFTSTGIDDNATSTAITIDSSQNVGIGNAGSTLTARLSVDNPTNATEAIRIGSVTGGSGSVTGETYLGFSAFSSGTSQTYPHAWIGVVESDASDSRGSMIFGTRQSDSDVAPTTAMTIDDVGNVGIGTSPVGALLHLDSNTTDTTIRLENSTQNGGYIQYTASDALRFYTGSSIRATLDSSGNVGIGTSSPINVSSLYKGLTIDGTGAGGGIVHFSTDDTENARLISTPSLTRLATTGSTPIEFGIGGTGISQVKMRMDANGRFLINKASASSDLNLEVQAPSGFSVGSGFYSASTQSTIEFKDSNTTANYKVRIGSGGDDLLLFAGGSERMRIDSNGNVGIGVTNPLSALDVSGQFRLNTTDQFGIRLFNNGSTGGYIGSPGAGEISFSASSGTERMRLDSSGNLLVGATTLPSVSTPAGSAFVIDTANRAVLEQGANQTSAAFIQKYFNPNGQVGSISVSGTSTSFTTSSDVRLKKNIVDAPAGNIDAIRVRSFDWKTDGSHQTYGMIAQELVDVAPEAVTQGETENDMWGVDYSKLVPMMIKEIQDLKAEVAALKGE